jgi:hypothetical protein
VSRHRSSTLTQERQLYTRYTRERVEDATAELGASSSLLTLISQGQIDTIKRALSLVSTYSRGAGLVGRVLEQYMEETSDVNSIWQEDKSYAVEVFDWSLPRRYRLDGAQVN